MCEYSYYDGSIWGKIEKSSGKNPKLVQIC